MAGASINVGAQRTSQQGRTVTLRPAAPVTRTPQVVCVDPAQVRRARLNRLHPLDATPGRALAFDQEPAILGPDYSGAIALREFTVGGDVPTIQFRFVDGAVEVWGRQRMDTLAGRPVSVFQPSWPGSAIDRAMVYSRWGWDSPEIYWGDVVGGAADGSDKQVMLRIASTGLPNVAIQRLADDVQFSSHVVNIVLPGFGDGILEDDDDQPELARATARFYEFFQDTYDAVAIVPQRSMLTAYTAVHHFVKSDVIGIGQEPLDLSDVFHSAGRLHSAEMYSQFFGSNKVSNHETAHQWGSYVDWTAVAGVERAGHQPAFHDPLWGNSTSLMGAVLESSRIAVGDGGWHIERAPAPISYPPLTLYGMGLLPRDQVPEFVLFETQNQFNPFQPPAPGTPVGGGVRTATIFNVIGMLGEREGPIPAEWQRATIVVSRGALLSQREMNYWTFFAQRLEDPNASGVISYEGYGSFDLATGRRIDLRTDIRPAAAARIVQPLPVDFPNFGTTDIRGLTLDAPLRTLLTVGEQVRISGRVTLPNATEFNVIAFRFSQAGVVNNSPLTGFALGSGGTFDAVVALDPARRGRFQLELYLAGPATTTLFSRVQMSGFTIN